MSRWAGARVGASSLVVFRVCFGLLLAAWCCDYLLHDRVRYMFVAPGFHFSYFGLEWVQPWPPVLMIGQFVLMGLAALGVAVGFCYRISSLVLAIGFTHFFLIDRTTYQNHYYLCCLLCWTMVLIAVSSKWSIDVLIRRTASCLTLPAWNLWAVRFHIALPYFFGGVAKLDSDWLTGRPMQFMLMSRGLFVERHGTIDISIAAGILTWGGLLFDLLIVPALLWKPTRLAAFVVAAGFHLTNSMIFDIHIFPWLMICATTVFFDADWPDHVSRRFGMLWPGPAEMVLAGATADRGHDGRQFGRAEVQSRVLATASIAYICFHLLWPFRHWLYTGPAGWTEEGHYFAWRMMLRGKTSAVQYLVTDRQTGETVSPDLRLLLNPEQIAKSGHDPEMIHQLAHHLAERFSASGKPRPVVRAVALSSFNGRRPQLMIDPNVDLAAEPRSLRSKSWIVPLHEPLPDMPWTAPIHEWKEKIHLPEIDLTLRTVHTASTNLSPESVTQGAAL